MAPIAIDRTSQELHTCSGHCRRPLSDRQEHRLIALCGLALICGLAEAFLLFSQQHLIGFGEDGRDLLGKRVT